MTKIYTKEQIEYVRKIAKGRYNDEITRMFNERFGTNLPESKIKALKTNHKISSDVPRKCPRERIPALTTPEQDEYIKARAAGKTNLELQQMLKEKFDINMTLAQVKGWKVRRRIVTGLTGRFQKGHVPANKGKKLSAERYAKCAPTMFQPGNRPYTYLPVGTEAPKSDGYIWVKVADPNRWRQKHILIWEAEHGPRPDGHKIIFADGNKRNFDLENLLCVSNAELARMNQRGLIYDNAEATKSGALIARLITKAAKIKREKNK